MKLSLSEDTGRYVGDLNLRVSMAPFKGNLYAAELDENLKCLLKISSL